MMKELEFKINKQNNKSLIIEDCISHNQYNLAFILSKIYKESKLISSINSQLMKYFNLTDISILEKKEKKIIKVLLLCNWLQSSELCKLWNKMSKNNNLCWNNIQIVSEEPCDYYVVINRPNKDGIKLDPKKTLIFRMEPMMELYPEHWGPEWAKPDKNKYLFVGYHSEHYNNNEWHLSKTYYDLQQSIYYSNIDNKINDKYNFCDKKYDNIISTVLSDKYKDPGHCKRIDFVKFLESKKDVEVHVFGSNKKFDYVNYKGGLPYHEKDNAMFPYKYTFNVENQFLTGYYTEKLIDGILAESLVFYHGCIDIKNYIDERAYFYLELIDFEKDYEKVKKAINNNIWKERLPYIKQAKEKILNETQFFPRIEKIINENEKNN
jgi:hypothetical protein